MRLIKFKVENFRSVVDSGWIEAERVTSLIGVNESGKTNLLLPLWKLNPAHEGEIRPTSDYPKSNFAEIRQAPQKFWFIHTQFDIGELANKVSSLANVDRSCVGLVYVAKNFRGDIWVDFPNAKRPTTIPKSDLVSQVSAAATEIGAMTALAKEGSLKEELLAAIEATKASFESIAQYSADQLHDAIDKLAAAAPKEPATTSSIVPRYKLLLESLGSTEAGLRAPRIGEIKEVRHLILGALPNFVYYSNYGNLDSEIYLPHVVENLKREDLGAREAAKARTLRVLFSFVRLKPEEILELGREVDVTQRTRHPKRSHRLPRRNEKGLFCSTPPGRISLRGFAIGGSRGITLSNFRQTAIISGSG